ncbi:dolichyl-P-Man:Man(7)GlcNAc(2)-PP-dolichol alpha-1 [Mactra antiquata]
MPDSGVNFINVDAVESERLKFRETYLKHFHESSKDTWHSLQQKAKKMGFPIVECLSILVMILHVFLCPYTKVEESFNIQAIHDILQYKTNISQYDHLQFPGVVPRSFLGPLVVAISSFPLVQTFTVLDIPKIYQQYIVRLCLGNAVLVGLLAYTSAIREKFGSQTAKLTLLITVTQFHFMFYCSRTLPNIFALVLVLFALRSWLNQSHVSFMWLSGAAILIYRSELTIFLGILLLLDLFWRRLSVLNLLKIGIPAGIILLGLTVIVDSYFWQRFLWPEGEVLWYNTILNKSSNWALPRSLSFSIFLIPIGLYMSPRLSQLVLPALIFVLVYSFLPHKELRFIIYVIPVCNTAVAEALHLMWINKDKSVLRKFLAVVCMLHMIGNLCTTGIFIYTSYQNYPGGTALYRLHQIESPDLPVHVHIDVPAAQTGITRFGQIYSNWIYNKTEDLEPGGTDMMSYTHIILGDNERLPLYKHTHNIIENITGFDRIEINVRKFPFLFWKVKDKMWILKKK